MALRELIDKNELQRLQDGFCKIAGISAYCLDHDGIKITRISGDDRYLHCLQEKLALERVQGKESLEDLAIEDIEGKKQVAALSVQARGEKELYWIIFRPENMTDETFYQALDLLRDTSISLLQGKLQSEEELAVMRIAVSGNGKVVMAQVASHEMNVFTRGSDGKWTNTVKEMDDFTSELYRGIALDYEGKRMWRFERQEQDCWLMFTETDDDGAENTVAVMKVDDGAQHAYYVACPDNGNIVYFTCYLNGKSMLMKGVYEDGTFRTQLLNQGVNGLAANGDSR